MSALALLFVLTAAPAIQGPAPQPPPGAVAAGDTLSVPPTLENRSKLPNTVEVTLTAQPARLELAPGVLTDAYGYNGQVPGPTLSLREGDKVIIHFRNELPEETTVHWHGLHLPFVADGSPLHPIPPGGQVDYVFTVPAGTAGTYWYHPHPHHKSRDQIVKGLYGGIIVRAPDDPLPPLSEKLLILADNRFMPDGSVDLPARRTMQGRIDFENGREGDLLFVNGQLMPEIPIRSGEVQRWRIINASAARVYRLSIPGHRLLHVGSDGGLFEHPVETDEVLIANSERVEVLVRGTGAPGSSAVLRDLPYDRYIPQTRPANWNVARDLVALRYSDAPPMGAVSLPTTLRAVVPMDTAAVTARRVLVFTQGFINGKTMDLDRVDEQAMLGATEIWQIENLVGMDHPFHLHGFRFQVLDRNGVPEPYPSWKDSVNVPKHQSVRIIVRFDDYPGKWMYHCHIMDHESNGMMGILQVR